jgi:hypothetical protein
VKLANAVLVLALLACSWAQSATITVAGSLGDLDGNGSSVEEQRVVNYAAALWGGSITNNATFNLTVEAADLKGGTGRGGITSFDQEGRPNAGSVSIGNSLNSFSWFVDPTPEDNNEFTPDTEYGFLFLDGPEGMYLDLLSTMLHEIGHILAMDADLASPGFNVRYLSLISLEGEDAFLNLPSGKVPLAGKNNLSHFAPVGTYGKGRTLMDSPRLIFNGRIVRTLPDPISIEAINIVQRSPQDDTSSVPEPNSMYLAAIGTLLAACFKIKKR